MTAAVDRLRKYLHSRKSSSQSSSTARNQLSSSSSASEQRPERHGNNNSSIANNNNSNNNGNGPPRRRLQRGWWPDAQKRAERSFRAMEDLKEETFVLTEEHIEWTFDETKAELQCQLILPTATAMNRNKGIKHHSSSNNCTICMTEYDIGNVVIHSRNCSHVFHQDCILDWCSRENYNCPICRTTFWDPDKGNSSKKSKKKSVDARNENNNSNSRGSNNEEERDDNYDEASISGANRRRNRSDTADTDTLSEYAGGEQRSRGPSFDGDNNNDNVDDADNASNNKAGILASVDEGNIADA